MTNQTYPEWGVGSSRVTVAADPEPIALTSSDLATIRAWTQAHDLWLSSRASENTRRAYCAAWDDFFSFTAKLP